MSKKFVIGSILISILLISVLVIALNISFNVEGTSIAEAQYDAGSTLQGGTGTIVAGPDPSGYSYNTDPGDFESTEIGNEESMLPTVTGYDIYCLQPGGPIRWNPSALTYAEAQALANGSPYTSAHGCVTLSYEPGDQTYPNYFSDGTYTLPTAAAYIVSDPNTSEYGGYTVVKQVSLWNLRNHTVTLADGSTVRADDGLIEGSGESNEHGGEDYELDDEAVSYANFDSKVRGKGLQPSNQTSYGDDMKVLVDTDRDKYTVGTFKLNYTSGTYGNITFGGISNMVVYGYNAEGELVDNNIKIDKFILVSNGILGNEVTPDYFKPDSTYMTDSTAQVYPASGQEFYVVIDNPNENKAADDPDRIVYVDIKVDFQYMLANGEYTRLKGVKFGLSFSHVDSYHCDERDDDGNCIDRCHSCTKTVTLTETPQQTIMSATAVRTLYEQSLIPEAPNPDNPPDNPPSLIMDLGGIVWEDATATKEDIADGVSNTADNLDIRMKNVKVTLYEEDGTVATLLYDASADGISEEEIMYRINPTYTDENGEYLFKGLDPMKKYYVVFEYNGQRYLPTEYLNTANTQYESVDQMVNAELYNTSEWEVSSKGTESESSTFTGVEISRQQFDQRFSNITAYPENYPSSNSLGVGEYNATFTQKDLMGYTLDGNGNYSQTEIQLVDGYEFDEIGNETTTFKEGVISQRVREYILSNKEFPDDDAMRQIYSDIAGNDTELWRKLQFIEDCYIQAYSGSPFTQEIDLYPVYDQFYVNGTDEGNIDTSTGDITVGGRTYRPIYPGQFYVNLGLWRRQEVDVSARKDAFKAAIKINGKTVTYDYDKRAEENEESSNNGDGQDNNTYWDITVRMSDYDNYYGLGYNRDVYQSDYEFGTTTSTAQHPGDRLEVYVTYQVSVTNQSMTVGTQIREIVDYYDSEFTFKPNLSWVTFQYYKNTSGTVTDNYYEMMDQAQSTINDNNNNLALQYMAYDDDDNLLAVSETSANRPSTNKNLNNGTNAMYLHTIEDLKLQTGETAYFYLTFQVNKDDSGRIIVDNENDDPKRNLVEVNGYATYYRDGTSLPNGVEKGSNDIAGLLDRDSNPGNLVAEDLVGEKYEQNFEDDTDESKVSVIVTGGDVRVVNGVVWEDERNTISGDALIGNGIREEGEEDVAGVTVQLVEKCTDGTEWVWGEATSADDGSYDLSNFIPGDYIVRFHYGDSDRTALSTTSVGRQGSNIVSYNGQDYKSTSYQIGMTQEGNSDLDGVYSEYTDTANQNESGTYGYNIYEADQATEDGYNYSDAKDIWSRRAQVIDYSDDNVTNHVAEVLASPYQVPSYNNTDYNETQMSELYNELIENTQMVAETGVIAMEIEYDRQGTDGYDDVRNNADTSSKDYYTGDNSMNGNYVVGNVDFGLEERPKAQLEIDKSVANVRVTLANNTILFDINAAANNALWQDHQEYNIDEIKDDYDGIYPTYYSDDTTYEPGLDHTQYHRYSYRTRVDEIVSTTDKGLIQLTMDEEIMHGATIQITYAVKVTNVGETDYLDGANKDFYYLGNAGGASVVTTTANQVIDYVQNNLRFDANAMNNAPNNDGEETQTNSQNGWAVKDKAEIISENLVNSLLTEDINTFIDVIQTEGFNQELEPGEEITRNLILSQQITAENTEDDLSYGNMVEIVKTSNQVGRRMAYSVVGNQDPTHTDADEVDANVAERIVILPPFGEERIYYLLGFTIAAVLVGGIILIRRKVLKGKADNK